MANLINEKLSQIRKVPECTSWPPYKGYVDPCWLEPKSLLTMSNTVYGFKGKSRDMSVRFTYGELFELIMKLLTTMITGTYTLSGRFNFATNAKNAYFDNIPANRAVINYGNLRNWLDTQSGYLNTLRNITYGDGTNPKY